MYGDFFFTSHTYQMFTISDFCTPVIGRHLNFFISLQLSYTESWKFSTGQFFLYMYNFWYLWQISGLVWMLIWADVVVWYSTPNVQKTESLNFWKQIWTTNVRNPERPKPWTSETPNVPNTERPNPQRPKPRSSETPIIRNLNRQPRSLGTMNVSNPECQSGRWR